MNKKDLLFERLFGSNRSDDESLLNDYELTLASFVYDVAYDEIHKDKKSSDGDLSNEPDNDHGVDDDTDSVLSFDRKVEAAVENFERIVELFKKLTKAKNTFEKSFDHWSSLRKSNVQSLREIAQKIQNDKLNCNVAKVVGGVVTVIGGVVVCLSFLTPLAVVSLPLAIGGGVASSLGSGVVVGTKGTKIVLLKIKLKEAKILVMEDKESFSSIAHYFTQADELKESLDSLVGYSLFKDMLEVLKNFDDEVKEVSTITEDDLMNRFKQALKLCIKMCKISNTLDIVIAPAIMTFVIVVCLLINRNRIVLDCILQADRLVVENVNYGVLFSGRERACSASIFLFSGRERPTSASIFHTFGVVIEFLNVILSSIKLNDRSESEHAIEIRRNALKLEEEFLFIEKVYNEIKNCSSIDWTDLGKVITQQKTVKCLTHSGPAEGRFNRCDCTGPRAY